MTYYPAAQRKYHASPKGRATQHRYNASKKGKANRCKTQRAYYRRDPTKHKAKRLVQSAVANGMLPKVTDRKCADCDRPAECYHHESYEREDWLNVVPLCKKCHYARHGKQVRV